MTSISVRHSSFLLLALGLSVLLATGCRGTEPAANGETVQSAEGATDYADAMAREHADDHPAPSAAAETAPVAAVSGDPVVYASIGGQEITGYLARPTQADHPLPGLIVIHEWWGLNDNIRAMTRRLAGEGYVALAVDLYGGQVATTPEEARELMGRVDPKRALENLRKARSHLADRLSATGDLGDRIGVIGWCFGGGWSLRAALDMPDSIDAAVVYYGHLVTDPAELGKLQAPLIGFFGAEDRSIPVDQVRAFQSTLEKLGKQVEVHVYDGAGHAFANPSGTSYQAQAAEDAWDKTVAFLAHTLQRPAGE